MKQLTRLGRLFLSEDYIYCDRPVLERPPGCPDGFMAYDNKEQVAAFLRWLPQPGRETAPELSAGARVEAKYGGEGKWFPGTIRAVNADDTFAVRIDDGDDDASVKPQHIQLAALLG